MASIIWLIIIIWIVKSALKNQKNAQNRRNYQPNQTRPTYQQNMVQPTRPQSTTQQADMARMQMEMTQKQRELKSRLQEKYRETSHPVQSARPTQQTQASRPAQQARPTQTVQHMASKKGDILSRAAANAHDEEMDELEIMQLGLDEASVVINPLHTNVMKELDDLMIMGYQSDLSFERDFIAEGVDMLNSFELSGM